MADLYAILYWDAVTLLLGLLLAFVLPLRRLWLILPLTLLLLPFYVPLFRGDVRDSLFLLVSLLEYVVSWTAGVFAGKALRRRWWRHQDSKRRRISIEH